MERLTEYESIGGYAHAILTGDLDKAIMRLAAYEDTGLDPEEVTALQKDWSALCTGIGECGGIWLRTGNSTKPENANCGNCMELKKWFSQITFAETGN